MGELDVFMEEVKHALQPLKNRGEMYVELHDVFISTLNDTYKKVKGGEEDGTNKGGDDAGEGN